MGKLQNRGKPSSPEEIARQRIAERVRQLEKDGEQRAAERLSAGSPGEYQHTESAFSKHNKTVGSDWGPNEAAIDLPANANVRPTGDGRHIRSDCFGLLRQRDALSEDAERAARRLQSDVASRFGLNSPDGWLPPVIDHAGCPGETTDGMLAAMRRLKKIEAGCGPSSWRLLMALIEPGVIEGKVTSWRATVQAVTGEADRNSQAGQVRTACRDLVSSYAAFDQAPKLVREKN